MTDTSLATIKADTPVNNPPTKWDVLQSVVGNLARPFVLYTSSLSASVLTVQMGLHPTHWDAGSATVLGAAWGGAAVLYGAKSLENVGVAKAAGPTQ